jgi:hypothetical protein
MTKKIRLEEETDESEIYLSGEVDEIKITNLQNGSVKTYRVVEEEKSCNSDSDSTITKNVYRQD